MTTQGEDAIVIEGVSKRFGRVLALDDVSMQVRRGEMFALLGPNGAGKSTLIDILCTIRPLDSGRATVAGADVTRAPRQVRRRIGVVFQDSTVDTRLTVRENLNFHGLVYQMRGAHRRRRITEMLELVELSDWADAVVRTLSTGMKRRLEIARALLHEPEVLFMDEPTVGLDAQSRAKIWEYLDQLRQSQNLTVVVTTHYIDEVESCDQVCIIDHGKILTQGTPEALKEGHGTRMLRATPTSPDAAARVRARRPDVLEGARGQLLLQMRSADEMAPFMAEFGDDLRQVELEQPSLESVFLSLTGRDLREAPAAAQGKGRRNGG
ncbi:MAG: ABC transporter ATP-binding protein [Paracoccaceae bacterium]